MNKNQSRKFKSRNCLLPLAFSACILFVFDSCSKDASYLNKENSQEAVSIKEWLTSQKNVATTSDKLVLDSLSASLDYASMEEGAVETDKNIILVPIRNSFECKASNMPIAYNNTASYLAITKRTGLPLSGSILQLDSKVTSDLSAEIILTIMNPSKGTPAAFSGTLINLSLSKKLYYQNTYEHGKLKNSSTVTNKRTFGQTGRIIRDQSTLSAPPGCTDWYLETTYYDEFGEVIDVTDQFLIETCETTGGTGGGTGNTPPVDCCVEQARDFDNEVRDVVASTIVTGYGTDGINATSMHKDFHIKVLSGYGGGWSLNSLETGIIVRDPYQGSYTPWRWQSFSHTSLTMSGSPLPGTIATVAQTGAGSTVLGDLSASFSLTFEVTFSYSCTCNPDAPMKPPVKKVYTRTLSPLNPNPQLD